MNDDHNDGTGSTVFFDHGAEAAVLGAMLGGPNLIGEVEALVSADDFHRPAHQLLFATLVELNSAGRPTDPRSLVAHLASAGQIRSIPDNGAYVTELFGSAPPVASATHFAGIVADRAMLRNLDGELARARAAIRDGGSGTSAEHVERVRSMVSDLGQRATGTASWQMWGDLIRPGLDEIERVEAEDQGPSGIGTGFPDLDRVIGGLQEGRLIVIAGQPGMGKTTLAVDFIRAAAFEQKIPVGMFSMEMRWQELLNRALCAEAAVVADRLTNGKLTVDDWANLARACGRTADAPLAIDDTPNLTFADIRLRARRLQQQMGMRLLVVDYLSLVACNDNRPRHQQIDELARRFKTLAGELGVAVVLLAQTNRNAGQRADKRPILGDLKESGGIEAHANTVIFVHSPSRYDKSSRVGETDLIVAKNRSGPECDVIVAAQLHFNRFASMALPDGRSF